MAWTCTIEKNDFMFRNNDLDSSPFVLIKIRVIEPKITGSTREQITFRMGMVTKEPKIVTWFRWQGYEESRHDSKKQYNEFLLDTMGIDGLARIFVSLRKYDPSIIEVINVLLKELKLSRPLALIMHDMHMLCDAEDYPEAFLFALRQQEKKNDTVIIEYMKRIVAITIDVRENHSHWPNDKQVIELYQKITPDNSFYLEAQRSLYDFINTISIEKLSDDDQVFVSEVKFSCAIAINKNTQEAFTELCGDDTLDISNMTPTDIVILCTKKISELQKELKELKIADAKYELRASTATPVSVAQFSAIKHSRSHSPAQVQGIVSHGFEPKRVTSPGSPR